MKIGTVPCPAPLDRKIVDRADGGFSFGPAGLETAEVVGAQQGGGGAAHGVGVEAAVIGIPREMPGEHVADRPVVDRVAIAFAHRVADRVETGRRVGRVEHGDVMRQIGVQCADENLRRQRRMRAERDDLPEGVNPGVGPAAGQGA